jgi:hypothetical protein
MKYLAVILVPALLVGGCMRTSSKDRGATAANSGKPASVIAGAAIAAPATKDRSVRPTLGLAGDGLTLIDPAGGKARTIAFGIPRDVAMPLIARARGEVGSEGENAECGAGPLEYANFAGGLVLSFQDDKFVGWTVGKSGEARLATATGLHLGSTRNDLDTAGKADVVASALGTEFSLGGLSGLLDGEGGAAKVTDLWAGTTCITR